MALNRQDGAGTKKLNEELESMGFKRVVAHTAYGSSTG